MAEYEVQQRGGAYHIDWSFHLHAAKFDLGAPIAPSDPQQLQIDGSSYGYQPSRATRSSTKAANGLRCKTSAGCPTAICGAR